ncbi:MAG TPA: GTPase ObgE [Acidimicrobiales bacterium]|nr:GTPase ObgE [Acidimicrobiales bacterium]
MSFVDEAQIHVKAGDGGAGAVSFRREAHVSKGGPDGGDGGGGGDVWLLADPNVASLLGFRDHPHRRAASGVHGQGKARHGAAGSSVEVKVPVGTVVKSLDGSVVADLPNPGDRWRAAEGGRGGRGNARFLSNRRRAPAFAEQGEVGEEHWFDLELKLMADVALVGLPNAGKSTLISRISAAKPKVADYPFTTLQPHLGVVRVGEREIVVADIPGLIEGASEGKGLGHQFLRHVERARVMVVLVDLAPADPDDPAMAPGEQQRVLLGELEGYRPELLERPRVVVGSKADMATCPFDGMRISAVTGEGLPQLVGHLADLVTQARDAETSARPSAGFVIHRPEPEGVVVERGVDGAWVVRGRKAERAVAVSDITNADALDFVQHRLKQLGVDRALARAGARDGEMVHIGGFTFEYEPDQVVGR